MQANKNTERKVETNKLCKIFKPRTAGYGLGFPATLFPVQSYGLYVSRCTGGGIVSLSVVLRV